MPTGSALEGENSDRNKVRSHLCPVYVHYSKSQTSLNIIYRAQKELLHYDH